MASAQLRLYYRRKEQGLCVACGKLPPRAGIVRCDQCASDRCEISKQQRARRPKGTCRSCLKRKTTKDRSTCQKCRSREGERSKQKYREIRLQVIALYGRKCQCPWCDVTNPKYLQLDHKNNDGGKERKSLPATLRGGRFFELVLKQSKRDDLQLLCANCHQAKRYGGCTEEDHDHADKIPTNDASKLESRPTK